MSALPQEDSAPPLLRQRGSRQRRCAVVAASCFALILLAIAFLDRPLALLAHDHLHGLALFVALTYIPEYLMPLAAIILAGFAVSIAAGRRWPENAMVLLRCSLALAGAVTVKDQLKFAFGRTWPETWTNNNPSFIGNGVFGFSPFHGGQGWAAFPSGHTTAICAVAAVLWICWPRLRWLYAATVALVVIGLLGADFHWLSDTIAGGFLGSAAGATAAAVGRAARPEGR
ncbi:MAG: phosphatase PAP2 family protein [Alphaproteobacteria bacterium]|nr:phosphatase PAP2 family protein [Alphaproteobacteria bacterium]